MFINPIPNALPSARNLNKSNQEDLVTELAWEYCQKSRNGEALCLATYLQKLPNNASKREFQLLISIDTFVDLSLDYGRKLAANKTD